MCGLVVGKTKGRLAVALQADTWGGGHTTVSKTSRHSLRGIAKATASLARLVARIQTDAARDGRSWSSESGITILREPNAMRGHLPERP
jgi:hypothetical protein